MVCVFCVGLCAQGEEERTKPTGIQATSGCRHKRLESRGSFRGEQEVLTKNVKRDAKLEMHHATNCHSLLLDECTPVPHLTDSYRIDRVTSVCMLCTHAKNIVCVQCTHHKQTWLGAQQTTKCKRERQAGRRLTEAK